MRNIVLYRTIYYSLSLLFGQGLLITLRIYLVSVLAVSELWVLVRDRKSTCSFAHFFSLFFFWSWMSSIFNMHKCPQTWLKSSISKEFVLVQNHRRFHLDSKTFAQWYTLLWNWSFKSFILILHCHHFYFRKKCPLIWELFIFLSLHPSLKSKFWMYYQWQDSGI